MTTNRVVVYKGPGKVAVEQFDYPKLELPDDVVKGLGVKKDASADEIKKAYRKLAKQYHPDTTGGDKAKEARFKDVQAAYDVLGDAKKKKLYDDIRAGGFARGRGGPGAYTYTSQGGGPGVFDLGDLFGQFFSGGRGPSGRVRVERMDFENARGYGGGGAEDAEFESKIQASDGTWLHVEAALPHQRAHRHRASPPRPRASDPGRDRLGA